MRKTKPICCSMLLCLTSACSQLADRTGPPAASPSGFVHLPELAPARGQERQGVAPQKGTPYGQTRVRLQFFREDVELDELDLDFDSGPDGSLRDVDRDRFGFRAEFGNRAAGGFFQLFGEQFAARAALGDEIDAYGIGGGVAGTPPVGRSGDVEFVVPYRFEVDLVGGSESSSGFDEDILYVEGAFDVGFGARMFGVQASSGLVMQSLVGSIDSDNPSSPVNSDPTMSGTNVGGYLELLYKHDDVPLMARVRALVGDIRGVQFSFGFAF
jgi:hypothetical protein